MDLIDSQKLEYRELISSVHDSSNINNVIAGMTDGTEACRALIKFDDEKLS